MQEHLRQTSLQTKEQTLMEPLVTQEDNLQRPSSKFDHLPSSISTYIDK